MQKPNKILLLLLLITYTLPSSEAEVYIVLTEKPNTEIHHIKTLSSVLGSEDAAKESLLYVYTFGGFAAKLTPEQADQISKQPGVFVVFKSQASHPDPRHGIRQMNNH